MQYIFNGLVSSAITAVAAIGFLVVYRTCGFFHFAYGGSIAIGAYALLVGVRSGLPLTAAVCLAVPAGTLIGLIPERLVFRPLRARGCSSLTLLLSSIGIYALIINCVALGFGNHTLTVRALPSEQAIVIAGASLTQTQTRLILSACMVAVVCFCFLHSTTWGKKMNAVASNADYAEVVGISVNGVCMWAIGFASALASMAGILKACDADISPGMGMEPLMMAIVAVIVGGMSYWGTILGSLLVGLAQHVGVIWLPTQWQAATTFGVLLTYLLIKPQSLTGNAVRRSRV